MPGTCFALLPPLFWVQIRPRDGFWREGKIKKNWQKKRQSRQEKTPNNDNMHRKKGTKRQLSIRAFTKQKAPKIEFSDDGVVEEIATPRDGDIIFLQGPVIETIRQIESDSIDLVVLCTVPLSEKDADVYVSELANLIAEVSRVLARNGCVCWHVMPLHTREGSASPLDLQIFPVFHELGFKLRNRIVWRPAHNDNFVGYGVILWWTVSDDYVFNLDDIRVPAKYPGKLRYKGKNVGTPSGNPLGKNPSDVWVDAELDANRGDETRCIPTAYLEREVKGLTKAGGRVLDLSCVDGKVLCAAKRNNRQYVGVLQNMQLKESDIYADAKALF